ncbi:OmpP1/FadL family transporter [Candidatus Laterigemmans baculatus]|uniref:OmpP1/FadL family transporter n=1 Tax=Candidatus Laterigemmans baculatus TaxID=2770505 RepID=UPI0013DA008C|nr:outer membrane protein transport protein [Candidatus Laterigemmans baculatus]
MKRFRLFLLGMSMTFLAANPSAADGVVRDGLGAISGGRGGTNLGHFDNAAVLHDNPAAMVNLPGRGMNELSIDGLMTSLHYREADNGRVTSRRTPYPLPHLAMIRKSDDGLWAYGLGIFAPAGFGAEYEMVSPTINPMDPDHEYTYKTFAALGKVLPGLSAKLTDRLSIGGTLGVAVNHVELEAPLHIQTGPFAGTPTVMDLQGTGAALCWSVGLQYALAERTMLGVTYTSQSQFELDGSAKVDVAGLGRSGYDLETGITWPQSVGVGIRHELAERHTLSTDVLWFDWSEAFDSLELTMTNPTDPTFAGLLGPTVRDALPLNWRDTVSVRVGYEYDWTCCTVLRAGYVYHRNPIPNSTLTPFIPATLEHALSTGFGHRWDHSRFDMGYQYSFGPSCTVGTSDVVGGDFDNSWVDSSAHWLFASYQQQF